MMPCFSDPAAASLWRRYFARVDRFLALAGEDAAGMRADLEEHLADGFAAQDGNQPEHTRLEAAIRRLGEPHEYLRPLVADGLIDRATRHLNPAGLARGLYHAIRLGSMRMVVSLMFGLGYLLVWSFFLMALLWPLWRGHVGLFRWPSGFIGFGFHKSTAGAVDLLGWWTMPVMLAAAFMLHLLLTKALRRAWAAL